ncbi:MAG: YkgJ family cysteine cluster protein [Planctomycetota bacterium]
MSETSSNSASSKPWYHQGLSFTCTQCGECCSGDPGFVYVDTEEISSMAELMNLERDAFEDRFVRQVGSQQSLKEYPDGDCILLDPESRKCLVYSARPVQCRTWPFWDSNLTSKRAWRETCDVCPGAGQGKLYTLEQIESQRARKSV